MIVAGESVDGVGRELLPTGPFFGFEKLKSIIRAGWCCNGKICSIISGCHTNTHTQSNSAHHVLMLYLICKDLIPLTETRCGGSIAIPNISLNLEQYNCHMGTALSQPKVKNTLVLFSYGVLLPNSYPAMHVQ